MAGKRIIEIKANTIDAAAGEIIGILEGTSKHERNIYFHGWSGLGAFTVLRVVAQRLKSSAAEEMKFDKVVHVDCSLWQSMRALQKAIAEELELPQSVMAIFDQHEEEDDFNGIDQGSRGVILDVTEEIFRKLVNSTFVVIFHNGSGHDIDLNQCGVPVTIFLSSKVLWTWGRRFRLHYFILDDFRDGQLIVFSGVQLRDNVSRVQLRDNVLHEEATEVAKDIGILQPEKVIECFQYVWARRRASRIDWGMHASNYWVCDGIIQGQGNTSAWEVGDALQRNIHLDWNVGVISIEKIIDECISGPDGRWFSATHQAQLHDGNGVLPPQATSFFLLADKSEGRRVILPAVMFPDNNRLSVLHLSWCTFSFTSPPFLCCNHLRFLLLDHCTDAREEEHQSDNQNGPCFQKLWVLDLRYTDWYSEKMMCLMDELRELNVEGVKDWMSKVDLCGSTTSLVKVRVAADPDCATEIIRHWPVPNMPNASHLKTIILESCVGLEQVVPDVLPPLLESFSFIVNDAAIAKISSISFQGLAKLKSLQLRGLMERLEELDLSGTAVKTLNLREVVARNLKRLIMLDCQKLQAIQWPPKGWTRWLKVLRINTIQSGSSDQANCEEKSKETIIATGLSYNIAVVAMKQNASFDKYIYARDGRLLRSLVPVSESFELSGVHMEMSSSPASSVAVGGSAYAQQIRQPGHYLYARDIIFQNHLHVVASNEGAIRWMWGCPPAPVVDTVRGWYVHIQVEEEMKSGLLKQEGGTQGTSTGATSIPDYICKHAKMLHVHDCLSITSIPVPGDSVWTELEQCRVERCPNISSVFAALRRHVVFNYYYNDDYVMLCFDELTTFWASQLLLARYIWNWSTIWQPSENSFRGLEFLHLDYCPRLIHVLPLSVHMTNLPHLVTLEIVCCGDLMDIFPLDPERQEKQTIINFPELKHIHLHDLPRLQRICGSKMLAPKLETIKIRGCWSLRCLPAVGKQCPMVDCEKDWWDSLEWEEGGANHHPSLYKPTHSRYYRKAQLPRGTVLR